MPLDPLTENQNAIMGMPLKAAEYQDHDAHIASHAPIAEQNPAMQAHINEHLALKMRVQVQQMIGQPLPPPGMPLPPEIENQLAVMVAQAMQQLAPQYKPQAQPDPLLEIEAAKVTQRAAGDQLKAKVEMKRIEMEALSDAEDRKTKEEIALIKAAADMQKQNQGFFGG
jgi:hypothetical protein